MIALAAMQRRSRFIVLRMRRRWCLVVALAAFGAGGGCGSTTSSHSATGKPCSRESDCADTNLVCGYKIADGCSATGTCVPRTPAPGQPTCLSIEMVCGCNGITEWVGCGYYSGYAPAPTASQTPCAGDAGTGTCTGWGGVCNSSGPCCDGLGCSPSGDSTYLPGVCVPL